MGPTWGPSGANKTQVGPMLAPWTLLSGIFCICRVDWDFYYCDYYTDYLLWDWQSHWCNLEFYAFRVIDNSYKVPLKSKTNSGHRKVASLIAFGLHIYQGLVLLTWISIYIHYKVGGEIIHPFPTFIVWEWISNFIPSLGIWLLIHVGIKVNPFQ